MLATKKVGIYEAVMHVVISWHTAAVRHTTVEAGKIQAVRWLTSSYLLANYINIFRFNIRAGRICPAVHMSHAPTVTLQYVCLFAVTAPGWVL